MKSDKTTNLCLIFHQNCQVLQAAIFMSLLFRWKVKTTERWVAPPQVFNSRTEITHTSEASKWHASNASTVLALTDDGLLCYAKSFTETANKVSLFRCTVRQIIHATYAPLFRHSPHCMTGCRGIALITSMGWHNGSQRSANVARDADMSRHDTPSNSNKAISSLRGLTGIFPPAHPCIHAIACSVGLLV